MNIFILSFNIIFYQNLIILIIKWIDKFENEIFQQMETDLVPLSARIIVLTCTSCDRIDVGEQIEEFDLVSTMSSFCSLSTAALIIKMMAKHRVYRHIQST